MNPLVTPSRDDSLRRIRTHALWKVDTHMTRARAPTSSATRSFISPAALFVKVMARISPGWASPVASRWAIRRVSTLVLPEPAPATMSNGPPRCSTAARWDSLRSSTRLLARLAVTVTRPS
ncbi:unannotated protein [freshwater metagenome]|uniref:Unannotated protein n=1 Tax=freshwater metagenome TaxID=449393 RepID=A0A6J6TNK9_9ZZZZ